MLSEPLLDLGRIHWYLLHADKLMMEKRFAPHPPGEIHKSTRTEFWSEVENDEINWWVFKRERDLPLFRKKTELTLVSAQALKEAAQKVSKSYYDSLEELNRVYENFGEKFKKEIAVILEYVQWLYKKDELAPSILFNFRTWGSTRMANRIEEVTINDLDNLMKVEKFSLIVLGLIQRSWLTLDRVKSEIEYEEYEKIDPETYSGEELIIDPMYVHRRTAYDASNEFAEYFEQLRDSLRNVILDIEQREKKERLFMSDNFWRSFTLKAAASNKTEQKYWDFKQSLDMWHVKDERTKKEKENKFAEIVAGFANNQGGVIIVGVTDASPRQVVGLTGNSRDIENYMKDTKKVISQYISYEKEFVHLQQVNVPDQNGVPTLCLVVVIQQTVAGISVMGGDGKSYSYPVREETGLVWKNQNTVGNKKIGTKSDNYNFLEVLQQFVNEEI